MTTKTRLSKVEGEILQILLVTGVKFLDDDNSPFTVRPIVAMLETKRLVKVSSLRVELLPILIKVPFGGEWHYEAFEFIGIGNYPENWPIDKRLNQAIYANSNGWYQYADLIYENGVYVDKRYYDPTPL